MSTEAKKPDAIKTVNTSSPVMWIVAKGKGNRLIKNAAKAETSKDIRVKARLEAYLPKTTWARVTGRLLTMLLLSVQNPAGIFQILHRSSYGRSGQ